MAEEEYLHLNKYLDRKAKFVLDMYPCRDYFELAGYRVILPNTEEVRDKVLAFFNSDNESKHLKESDCKDLYIVYKVNNHKEIIFAATFFVVEVAFHITGFVFWMKTLKEERR